MAQRAVGGVWVIDSDGDLLSWDVEPFIFHSRLLGLSRKLLEVGLHCPGRWYGFVALQQHVEQSLQMHGLVLKAQPHHTTSPSITVGLARFVKIRDSLADSALVVQHLVKWRILIGDLTVSVNMLGVVDVRIDATLEDLSVVSRVRRWQLRAFDDLHVQERRNVTEVEDACIAKLDRLLVELIIRNHLSGNSVPGLPE